MNSQMLPRLAHLVLRAHILKKAARLPSVGRLRYFMLARRVHGVIISVWSIRGFEHILRDEPDYCGFLEAELFAWTGSSLLSFTVGQRHSLRLGHLGSSLCAVWSRCLYRSTRSR